MNDLKTLAVDLLSATKKYPTMYATSKEAYIMRISTILEMADENFCASKFYEDHLKIYGSIYTDLHDNLDEGWALKIADDAICILNNK